MFEVVVKEEKVFSEINAFLVPVALVFGLFEHQGYGDRDGTRVVFNRKVEFGWRDHVGTAFCQGLLLHQHLFDQRSGSLQENS